MKSETWLFLSVDIADSTEFKQPHGEQEHSERGDYPWQEAIFKFYWIFPYHLREAKEYKARKRLAEKESSGEHNKGEAEDEWRYTNSLWFHLWKAAGDELIYRCRVESEYQVYAATRVWLRAVQECYKTDMRYGVTGALQTVERGQMLKDQALGLKASAFLATFPAPDSVALIPTHPDQERERWQVTQQAQWRDEFEISRCFSCGRALDPDSGALGKCQGCDSQIVPLVDHIGPSIDTGFRISSQASTRFFTMSADVAYAIVSVLRSTAFANRDYGETQPPKDQFVYLGERCFKGVWNRRPYPVFAWDVPGMPDPDRPLDDNIAALVDRLSPIRRTWEQYHDHYVRLLSACLTSDTWPTRIVLSEAKDDIFKRPSPTPWQDTLPKVSSPAEVTVPVEELPGNPLPDDVDMGLT